MQLIRIVVGSILNHYSFGQNLVKYTSVHYCKDYHDFSSLLTFFRVAKDNKRYDINVETIPAKFAPQKRVSYSYLADDYTKSIKLVLNKTAVTQRPAKPVRVI